MNRDNALQAARDQLEASIWDLLSELENSLASLASVPHMNIECPRAIGSVLNSALPAAAQEAGIEKDGLEVKYCRNGQCNKISGHVKSGGETFPVSLELHLSGPRGGTTKSKHQFRSEEHTSSRNPPYATLNVSRRLSILMLTRLRDCCSLWRVISAAQAWRCHERT